MAEGSSLAVCNFTDNSFADEYLEQVEELPNDISRYISNIREISAKISGKTHLLDDITHLLKDSGDKSVLFKQAKKIAAEICELKLEKEKVAEEMNEMIREHEERLEKAELLKDTRKSVKKAPVGTSTPFFLGKRGRKYKKALHENKQELTPDDTSFAEEDMNLKLLADVALVKKEDEDAVVKGTFGKLPVTKRSEKGKKRRKNKASSSTDAAVKDEDESDDDDALAETDENEPVYCLCNKISFGPMVECSNEACAIEWFHFPCVGIKRAPKGKWYCPKCRSRKSTQLKKELVA